MKKRLIAFLMATLMLGSTLSASAAVTRASDWIDSVYFNLNPTGNGNITITYGVFGTDTMTKIGVNKIWVEEEVGPNDWMEIATYGANYSYNTMDHLASFKFGGDPGGVYHVVMEAYAKDSRGSFTKTYTSTVVTCK